MTGSYWNLNACMRAVIWKKKSTELGKGTTMKYHQIMKRMMAAALAASIAVTAAGCGSGGSKAPQSEAVQERGSGISAERKSCSYRFDQLSGKYGV